LVKQIPEITSVVNSVTRRKAHVAVGEEAKIFFGNGIILEKLNNGNRDLFFKISPNSFFQTNTKQAELLYSTGESFLELKPEDNVLDLYCGAGAITLFISDKVNSAFGVELMEDAVLNAKENSELNNITNCMFIAADIRNFLKDQIKDLNFNKLVLDPPRSGLHPDIAEILSNTSFEKILYISCNPSTQARDIATICSKGKYIISKIQPVDMFPHTYHVENICLLDMIQ
jgi:23S rRNA (uracil1939-C5)-methyltransferase